jgi:hypothetical protein
MFSPNRYIFYNIAQKTAGSRKTIPAVSNHSKSFPKKRKPSVIGNASLSKANGFAASPFTLLSLLP